MKKSIVTVVAVAMVSSAIAVEKPSIPASFRVGYTEVDNKGALPFEDSSLFGFALGASFRGDSLGIELEYLQSIWADGGQPSGSVDGFLDKSFMLNGVYMWQNDSVITPYTMLGIGAQSINITVAGTSVIGSVLGVSGTPESTDSEILIAAQAGVGATITLIDQLSLDLGARYMLTQDYSYQGNSIELSGVRYIAGLTVLF